MEAMFKHLRRHQRRIRGCKSTAELRDFGQYQVLFLAESEKQLLEQIQQVPVAQYKVQRRRLALSELLANANIAFTISQLPQYKLWLTNIRNFSLCLILKLSHTN
jgi:hypothetical protein